MQDRFKFRVWKGQENRMVYDVTYLNPLILDPAIKEENKHNILMQCTGLKDKNGKLIYEGDIVKIEYYDFEIKHRFGIVEWEDDGFCITYHNPKDTKVSGCSLVDIVNGDKQEVICNIYENKEILNEI